jgi:small subunit ribosomal protein S1
VLNGRAKISLSIKQVNQREEAEVKKGERAPKEDLSSKISIGQLFDGKITRKEVYGVFVQLEPGLNGLLHKSRIGDSKEIQFEKLRVNDTIRVQVVEVKGAERQISLGLPGVAGEDDWRLDYKTDSAASLGTLGSKFAAALQKKK